MVLVSLLAAACAAAAATAATTEGPCDILDVAGNPCVGEYPFSSGKPLLLPKFTALCIQSGEFYWSGVETETKT